MLSPGAAAIVTAQRSAAAALAEKSVAQTILAEPAVVIMT